MSPQRHSAWSFFFILYVFHTLIVKGFAYYHINELFYSSDQLSDFGLTGFSDIECFKWLILEILTKHVENVLILTYWLWAPPSLTSHLQQNRRMKTLTLPVPPKPPSNFNQSENKKSNDIKTNSHFSTSTRLKRTIIEQIVQLDCVNIETMCAN